MASAKQRAAARRNIKKAHAARKKKPKRSSTRHNTRKPMAKKRRGTVSRGFRRAKSGFGNVLKSGVVGKVVMGVGAATVVGLAVDRFAPQFSGIARPIAAFIAGGPIGGIASIFLSGGLGNILGGQVGGNGGDAI